LQISTARALLSETKITEYLDTKDCIFHLEVNKKGRAIGWPGPPPEYLKQYLSEEEYLLFTATLENCKQLPETIANPCE
jgi:hypothetical protein